MSSSSSHSVPVNSGLGSLLYSLILAQQAAIQTAEDGSGSDDGGDDAVPSSIPMPTPLRMPHPASVEEVEEPDPVHGMSAGSSPWQSQAHMRIPVTAAPPMPQPSFPNMPAPSAPSQDPNSATNAAQSRPPSPTNTDVATSNLKWQLYTLPLYQRISELLYENENTLPPPTSGCIGYLKLDGYRLRETIENMSEMIRFLRGHKWDDQNVDTFVATMRPKPHWPKKLANAPDKDHIEHAWRLAEGLFALFSLRNYLSPSPPATFHGIVPRIFPELPETTTSRFLRVTRRVSKPQSFSFSVRDLLEEDLIIEPTNNMVDHLDLQGNTIKVFILDSQSARVLLSYHQNRAAQAIGMANFGNEVVQSYHALTSSEFQENFKLPISLGMFKVDPDSAKRGFDDLTVVTGIIRLFHNHPDFDPKPQLLASRVYAIERALRTRRRWYKRLRRDIHKRKKDEPWLFWGAVLAVFFGICTVIQTVTSVWGLVLAAKA